MSTGIWSAASGAVSKTSALDIASDNIANAQTPGFRSETCVFRQTLATAVDRTRGTESLHYAVTRTNVPYFSPGQIVQTGHPLDVAIPDGNGFFVVSTPDGPRYTRAGSFRVAQDGSLVLPDGAPLLGEDRRPIKVDPTQVTARIDASGQVLDNENPVGKLLVVQFADVNSLQKQGNILLRATPQTPAPTRYEGRLNEGSVEQSNANAVSGMTQLVTLSREFEMLTKVIEAFSNIDRRAATDIASPK